MSSLVVHQFDFRLFALAGPGMCVCDCKLFCSLRACSHRQYIRHNRISVGFIFWLSFSQLLRNRHDFFRLDCNLKVKKETEGERRKNISNFGWGREKNGRITCNPTLSIKRAINTAWVSLSVCSFRATTATETAITKQNNPRQWQQQNKKTKKRRRIFICDNFSQFAWISGFSVWLRGTSDCNRRRLRGALAHISE